MDAIEGKVLWCLGRSLLVLCSGTEPGTVKCLRVGILPPDRAAARLIWPRQVLIDQTWCSADVAKRSGDTDFQIFPAVALAQDSLRLKAKLWIDLNQLREVDIRHLKTYPAVTSSAVKALPNPPVYLSSASLRDINKLASKLHAHPVCTEPTSPSQAPRPSQIAIGTIYRLPFETADAYLRIAQSYSFFERPLGKPFLVTAIYISRSNPSKGRVAGFVITNFHHQTITYHFRRQDPKTRWIRAQYIPIEGIDAEAHDGMPYLKLANASPQFGARQYVHCLKSYVIDSEELLSWTAEGEEEVRIDEDDLDGLRRCSKNLQDLRSRRGTYQERSDWVTEYLNRGIERYDEELGGEDEGWDYAGADYYRMRANPKPLPYYMEASVAEEPIANDQGPIEYGTVKASTKGKEKVEGYSWQPADSACHDGESAGEQSVHEQCAIENSTVPAGTKEKETMEENSCQPADSGRDDEKKVSSKPLEENKEEAEDGDVEDNGDSEDEEWGRWDKVHGVKLSGSKTKKPKWRHVRW